MIIYILYISIQHSLEIPLNTSQDTPRNTPQDTPKDTPPFETSIRVIDSHTGGEPTRVVVTGGPNLGSGSMAERLGIMREEYDHLRSAMVNEPRGSDVLVGALLCDPVGHGSAAGVIFFNNVGYLSMCGHGSIGLAVTLLYLGRMSVGQHRLDTPAGEITVTLHDRNKVSVRNVESYRHQKDVVINVPGIGHVTGDVAWGGNWFFLISDHGQSLDITNVTTLTNYAWAVRAALETAGVRGRSGEIIDHVELFGPPSDTATADSKNFVLCPGRAYDRSPCGTGTSAKLACLIEDGRVQTGEIWRQESITGSIFDATAEATGDFVRPVITGSAFITGESTLLIDPADPFRYGLAG